MAAIELDDARGEAGEERAVVRDEHERAAVLHQKRFEPFDGLDVEVVGWLVEQEQRGLGDERAGEQHATTPAAGERVNRRVRRQAEAIEHQLDALFDAPAVLFLELVLQPSERLERGGGRVFRDRDGRVMIGGHDAAKIAKAFGDDVEHGAGRRERGILDEPRGAEAGLAPDRATIWLELAGEDSKQRGLAGAVSSDQRNPLAAARS